MFTFLAFSPVRGEMRFNLDVHQMPLEEVVKLLQKQTTIPVEFLYYEWASTFRVTTTFQDADLSSALKQVLGQLSYAVEYDSSTNGTLQHVRVIVAFPSAPAESQIVQYVKDSDEMPSVEEIAEIIAKVERERIVTDFIELPNGVVISKERWREMMSAPVSDEIMLETNLVIKRSDIMKLIYENEQKQSADMPMPDGPNITPRELNELIKTEEKKRNAEESVVIINSDDSGVVIKHYPAAVEE